MKVDYKLEFSEIESKRFGLKIHRLNADFIDLSALKKQILNERTDITFLRLNVSQKASQGKLSELPYEVIHADTLNYYAVNLEKYEPNRLRNELVFEQINSNNAHHLDQLVAEIFNGYQNHYFSNPFLDRSEIIEGYIEWAKSYVLDKNARISWYVFKGKELIGFATCKFDEKDSVCEGVLYGVRAQYSGGGVYTDIIRFTQQYFKMKNFSEMLVSTQVQNFAVQKVWGREGFFLKEAFDTYHINAFLSSGKYGSKEFIYQVSEKEIEDFAAFSKDRNRIHFDDDFAQNQGFKSRISHGMIYEAKLSYILGNDFPGTGTIIVNQKTTFVAPIYPNLEYRWTLRCFGMKPNGFQKISATVESKDGRIAIISYSDVIRKID